MEKLEKLVFYFLIFSIPFQTRKILFSVYSGKNFLEWGSGFLYFTDLLIIAILFSGFLRKGIKIKKKDIWLGAFFLIATLSLITSQNLGLSVYQLIKLAEFILLFLYIRSNLDFLGIKKILTVIVASGTFQALLAIVQFFNQSSLGLKHFEAGIFNANIPGVATFFVNGVKFMRAYGTAPHPNVLAVFLLVAIFCLYYLCLTRMPRIITRMTRIILLFILVFGLFLTFSRAVIIIFIGASLAFFLTGFVKFKRLRLKISGLFVLFAVICILFTASFWPEVSARFLGTSLKEQAVTLRVYYNDIAISAIKQKPLLGLGLGNFVLYLYNNYHFKEFWLYQPVHNLYLLIASEMGILGLIVFLIFLWKILFKKIKYFFFRKVNLANVCFLFLVFCFLALGLIDHYFWTIQQSRLIFWLVLAFLGL